MFLSLICLEGFCMFRMRRFLLFVSIFLLGLVAGCAKYSAQPLKPLHTVEPHRKSDSSKHDKSEKSISLACHVFDKYDCKKYLDRDVLVKGYLPVQITITNDSDRFINVSKSNFSIPVISACDVAKKVHTSTLTRAASYGVAGLFLWPFLIPAVVDGVGSSQANQKLDDDFMRKEFADQTIPPFGSASGLIFVDKNDFMYDFTITAIDLEKRIKFVLNAEDLYLRI